MDNDIKKSDDFSLELRRKTRDLILDLVLEKHKVIPLISTIVVAILVIFSFGDNIIINKCLFNISLIILIFIIPVSLTLYLVNLDVEIKNLEKLIEKPDYSKFRNVPTWERWLENSSYLLVLLILISLIIFTFSLF